VRAQYHGLKSTAPILTALNTNHPEQLPKAGRDTLVETAITDFGPRSST